MRTHARPLSLLVLLAGTMLAMATAIAAPKIEGRRLSVGANDAQGFLDGRFPHRQGALGGMIEVTVSNPLVAMPAGNRVLLAMDLGVATAGGDSIPLGTLTLSSALRFDPGQGAFFLDQPRVDRFKQAGSGEDLSPGSRELINAWLSSYAVNQPVYRIEPALTAALGGVKVESATVENGRLVVTFDRDISAVRR